MTSIRVLAVSLLVCTAATSARAATFFSVWHAPDIQSIYFNGAELNGSFDTVIFRAIPGSGTLFTGVNSGLDAGFPRPPGQPSTYRNRMLSFDPLDDPRGLGWTIVGVETTDSVLGFTGGPLGQKISTADQPGGNLFLANLRLTSPVIWSARLQLVNAGSILFDVTLPFPIPEPATSSLALAGLCIAFAGRRRSQRPSRPSA